MKNVFDIDELTHKELCDLIPRSKENVENVEKIEFILEKYKKAQKSKKRKGRIIICIVILYFALNPVAKVLLRHFYL